MNQTLKSSSYIGRFAPSPTGPLHFGSLIAATASYLDARAHQGQWLLRMEDLDQSREHPGSADDILRTLTAFGFKWDTTVLYQSMRQTIYQDVLDNLKTNGLAYPCGCSRREITQRTKPGGDGLIYPGFCRQGLNGRSARSWRVKIPADSGITVADRVQQTVSQKLPDAVGDFVLRRADGFFAYQLAVVVDDAVQNISHIVRGADLLDSTPRQVFLQQQLRYPTPLYAHIPVAIDSNGAKLSKQQRAEPVQAENKGRVICQVLQFLGLKPPEDLAAHSLDDIWHWAIANWQINQVPRCRQQTAPEHWA